MEAITNQLSFDQLPNAVSRLYIKAEETHLLVLQLLKKNEPQQQTDQWFDIDKLCNYLPDQPAKPTVYGWVSNRLIPCHKGQKKLRFLKSEIDIWLKTGRKKTIAEIADEADTFLQTKKKGTHN